MKLLKNREFKLSILISVLLMLIFGAVTLCTFRNFAQAVNQTQIRQNIAVIGSVVREYPALEAEIAGNYTKGIQGNYEYGKKILAKYSYNENLSMDSNASIAGDLRHAYFNAALSAGIFTLIGIILITLRSSWIYSRIRRIGESAEAVIEGKYEPIEGDRSEGDIGYLIHQFNSMTGRLSENVQALRNEKLFLKKLITDISHQLKTPMSSLIMFNDLLKNDNSLTDHERALFVEESRNQLERMEWLIKNMLKMAKLEAGVVDFDKKESKVVETLARSIMGLRHLASEKNIEISISGDKNITVKHDMGWTTEAFSNIIKNCLEHSEKCSEIHIKLSQNNVFAQIEIQDYGTGISKSELPKIFDRFYKGTNSLSHTNIGIGLYISKTIIEGQGGSIYACSYEGEGTKFTVRLLKTI